MKNKGLSREELINEINNIRPSILKQEVLDLEETKLLLSFYQFFLQLQLQLLQFMQAL